MAGEAIEIAEWLEDEGYGAIAASSGWALSIGVEPDAPDDVITVYDTGGEPPDNDDNSVERFNLQVRTRSRDYNEAYIRQQVIKNALIGAGSFGSFVFVRSVSEPVGIGKDDNDRFLFSANYQVMKST